MFPTTNTVLVESSVQWCCCGTHRRYPVTVRTLPRYIESTLLRMFESASSTIFPMFFTWSSSLLATQSCVFCSGDRGDGRVRTAHSTNESQSMEHCTAVLRAYRGLDVASKLHLARSCRLHGECQDDLVVVVVVVCQSP